MIKIDDHITKFVMDNFDIFEHIHPNVITIIGIICNYFILDQIDNMETNKINEIHFAILLFVRFLSDCLDGAVARKYKKTSKIGNILDTLSDMMFNFIIFYFFLVKFNLPNWWIVFYIFGAYIVNEKYSIFTTHETLKNGEDGIVDLGMNFLSNNTIIIFVIFFIIVINENKSI